ncbi:MAG: tetratricopeptide repeat protein [Planctomycetales bacterium]
MNVSRFVTAALPLLLLAGCRNPVFDWSGKPQPEDASAFANWSSRLHGDDGRLEAAPDRRGSMTSREGEVARLLDQAHTAAARKDLAAARTLYRQVLFHDDRHPEARHRLGILEDQRGDFRAAEEHYLVALAGKPRDPDLLSDVGYSYLLQARPVESEHYLMQALDVAPGHARATNNLGMLYARMGDAEGAYAMFRRTTSDSDARNRVAQLLSSAATPGAAPSGPFAREQTRSSSDRPHPHGWGGPTETRPSPPLLPANATTEAVAAAMREQRLRDEAGRQQRRFADDQWGETRLAAAQRPEFGAPPPSRNGAPQYVQPWPREQMGYGPGEIHHAAAYSPNGYPPGAGPADVWTADESSPTGHPPRMPIISPRRRGEPYGPGSFASASGIAPSDHRDSQSDVWPREDSAHPSPAVDEGRGVAHAGYQTAEGAAPPWPRGDGAGFAAPASSNRDPRAVGGPHAPGGGEIDVARRAAARMGLGAGPGAVLPVIESDAAAYRPAPSAFSGTDGRLSGMHVARTESYDPSRTPPPWPGLAPANGPPPAGGASPHSAQPPALDGEHRVQEYQAEISRINQRMNELQQRVATERARLAPGGGPARPQFPEQFAPPMYSPAAYGPVNQPANVRWE